MMVGRGRSDSIDARYVPDTIAINSYISLISAARTELSWLMASLSR